MSVNVFVGICFDKSGNIGFCSKLVKIVSQLDIATLLIKLWSSNESTDRSKKFQNDSLTIL